jgi:predicted ATPase
MRERSDILILSSFSHLLCLKDLNIRRMIYNDMMEEIGLLKIEIFEEVSKQFLNWNEDGEGILMSNGRNLTRYRFGHIKQRIDL